MHEDYNEKFIEETLKKIKSLIKNALSSVFIEIKSGQRWKYVHPDTEFIAEIVNSLGVEKKDFVPTKMDIEFLDKGYVLGKPIIIIKNPENRLDPQTEYILTLQNLGYSPQVEKNDDLIDTSQPGTWFYLSGQEKVEERL